MAAGASLEQHSAMQYLCQRGLIWTQIPSTTSDFCASGSANIAKSDFDHHRHFYTNLFLLLLHNFQSNLANNQ
jgi:hypothetical protein